MNAKEINASSLNRKILFFGVLFTLLLPALFSISADTYQQESSINAALDFSTYLGGEGTDGISGIAVDREGNIYVTGFAERSFPTTPNAFQAVPSKGNSAPFVAKLDAVSKAIIYSTFLGGQDSHTTDIAVDSAGNAYVTGETSAQDFPITPGAFQTNIQGTRSAFVTKLNSSGSALAYSTYLGGSGAGANLGECGSAAAGKCDTTSSAISVDSSGNAYITGRTNSDLLPTTADAFQKKRIRSDCSGSGSGRDVDVLPRPCYEAFVLKLNPAGNAAVYSTYLGGTRNDSAEDIAVDSEGNVYISGISNSSDFPLPGAISRAGNVFVTKLDSDASSLVYSTRIGDVAQQTKLAIDSSGNAYLTGIINSVNLATTPGAFRPESSSVLAFKSSDGGNNWERSHAGLTDIVSSMAVDPAGSTDIYAFMGYRGLARSSDRGRSWSASPPGLVIESLAFDPRHPARAYGSAQSYFGRKEIVKTTDGGHTWGGTSAFNLIMVQGLIVDPTDSNVAYALFVESGLFKTTDGFIWKKAGKGLPNGRGIVAAINRADPSILLALASDGLYRSENRGKRWKKTDLNAAPINAVVFGPGDSSVAYAAGAGIYRSKNTGQTWKKIETDLPEVTILNLLIAPTDSSIFYANTTGGAFRSRNRGRNWERIDGGLNECSKILAIDSRDPNTVYAGGCSNTLEVFAVRINSAGSAFDYVTYIGRGNANAVAVDSAGNAYLAGSTSSADFPIRNAFQPALKSGSDAFVARLNRSGTDVIFSTYYGGDGGEAINAIALDRAGNAWVAGWTNSTDLPTVGALQETLKGRTDAFIGRVVEFAPTARVSRISKAIPSSARRR